MVLSFEKEFVINNRVNRREFIKWFSLTATAFLAACQNVIHPTSTPAQEIQNPTNTQRPEQNPTAEPTKTPNQSPESILPTVFMTTTINADGLLNVYRALGRQANGRVAVKISSGEPGGRYFLDPDLIAPLVQSVNGTIVECNTAYGGGRADTASHLRVMDQHGFSAIAPVDIMDADGSISIPVIGGTHLTEDVVGSHLPNYDFIVNLAHFKGHAMGGLGGVIKNMSIGIASKQGKSLIHTAGNSDSSPWGGDQNDFLESMAEAAKGVADYMGENILYIDVMRHLSVDCDCNSNPATPTMNDIGILASLDPVALDQACVDLVYAAPDGQDLIARMESRNGLLTLEHGEKIGLGSRVYQLINID